MSVLSMATGTPTPDGRTHGWSVTATPKAEGDDEARAQRIAIGQAFFQRLIEEDTPIMSTIRFREGLLIDADRALAWGLVDEVVPPEEVDGVAAALARDIAAEPHRRLELVSVGLCYELDLHRHEPVEPSPVPVELGHEASGKRNLGPVLGDPAAFGQWQQTIEVGALDRQLHLLPNLPAAPLERQGGDRAAEPDTRL